jgi:excisionase family DNA binding protein
MYGVMWSDPYSSDDTRHFADVDSNEEARALQDALKHNGWDAEWFELPDTQASGTRARAYRAGSPSPDILTPVEVAQMFRVDVKTISRWAESGKIRSFKTLGGHRRFRRHWIESMLDQAATGGQIQ